jgi:hypothetical protein
MIPNHRPRSLRRRGPSSPTAGTLTLVLAVVVAALASATSTPTGPMPVSGTGIHFFSTAIVHSEVPTDGGTLQRSSEIVTLSGDVNGHLLYHPVSTFDDEAATLVNTGRQFFSGTVLGSAPVVLFDDRFRFDVDLRTGATVGSVHLRRSSDAPADEPWFECDLEVVGTGVTEEGDATFAYEGVCERHGE